MDTETTRRRGRPAEGPMIPEFRAGSQERLDRIEASRARHGETRAANLRRLLDLGLDVDEASANVSGMGQTHENAPPRSLGGDHDGAGRGGA